MTYDKVYIQKQDGTEAARELAEAYGIYAVKIPFIAYPAPKELPKNDWFDEDGEDVYVPNGRAALSAYDIKVKLAYKGVRNSAGGALKNFFDWILVGMFKIYDTHTGIGRQDVRVKSIGDDADFHADAGEEIVVFDVTLRVGDPTTEIRLKSVDGVYCLQ